MKEICDQNMYYYIMEQPHGSAERKFQKKIKDMVGMLGLAGETAAVSPARTVEELVEIATFKEYNTIVAVGGDQLINKIASLICGKEAVLGVIPINTSPLINNILGIKDDNINEAFVTLKKRYLKVIDLAYLYPQSYFLTQAEIKTSQPIEVELEIDQVKTTTKITDLIIVSPAINTIVNNEYEFEQSDNRLNIYLANNRECPSDIIKFTHWFLGRKTIDHTSSLFRARKIIINTSSPIPIFIDGKIIDKTPVIITTKPKALKIITRRGRIGEK